MHIEYFGQMNKIHDQARGLQVLIAEMQNGMKSTVSQPGVDITEIKGKDNQQAGREAILDSGAGRAFNLEAARFRATIEELITDPVTLNQIIDHLDFTGMIGKYIFGEKQIAERPLVLNYYHLSEASKGIALGEYVAISYLMHQ
jgi:hypothetical protein